MSDQNPNTPEQGNYPHEVTIKIRAFPYYVDIEDPVTGNTVRQERLGTRGDTVRLSDVDFRRAERFNAIETPQDQSLQEATTPEGARAEDVGAFSVETATVEQLAEWIKTDKPTVEDVVGSANEDPDVASRLLEAENLATGQQPRSTLVRELQTVIAGDAPGDGSTDEE